MTSLAVEHRPVSLSGVVGQDAVVKSLDTLIRNRRSSSFLFCGPSGCGKTTLARIAASMFGCEPSSVLEVDASTKTGVDDMRSVQDSLRYKSLQGSGAKAVIIDECHMLSKSAWNSLLKVVEEPPEHVFFFFCTTEPGKVPKTIQTRCSSFTLKLIPEAVLTKLVKSVMRKEGITVTDDVLKMIVSEANGSARQALVNLSTCVGVDGRKEAAELLRTAIQSEAVLELCRFLVGDSCSWPEALDLINKLADEAPESVRIMVVNYVGVVLKKERNGKRAGRLLEILQEFSEPYNPSEKWAPLLLSIGRVVFS
jgi:DNA polymerase-3 subunit gamma/tau